MTYLHPNSAIFFVTCTLKKNENSQELLSDPAFARILMTRLDLYKGKYYNLIAYSIAANQFHIMIDTSVQHSQIFDVAREKKKIVDLEKIITLIKDGSARYINQIKKTASEEVWEADFHALPIKDEKTFKQKIAFIKENPVKVQLVHSSEEHPFTYVQKTS